MRRIIRFLVFTAAALGAATVVYTVVRRSDFEQVPSTTSEDELSPEQEEALRRELENDFE